MVSQSAATQTVAKPVAVPQVVIDIIECDKKRDGEYFNALNELKSALVREMAPYKKDAEPHVVRMTALRSDWRLLNENSKESSFKEIALSLGTEAKAIKAINAKAREDKEVIQTRLYIRATKAGIEGQAAKVRSLLPSLPALVPL